MTIRRLKVIIGATSDIDVPGIQNSRTLEYPTDATVTLALADAAGNAIEGVDAIPLTYVAGTTGEATTYRGTLPATLPLSPQTYTGVVTVKDADQNVLPVTLAISAEH